MVGWKMVILGKFVDHRSTTSPILWEVIDETDERGRSKRRWVETEQARAVAFDVPVSGYANETGNVLKALVCQAVRDFDLRASNRGDYLQAVMDKQRVETTCCFVYPNDQAFRWKGTHG